MSDTLKFSAISPIVNNPNDTQTPKTNNELDREVAGVKNTVAKITAPDATHETTQEINYQQLTLEHRELITQGKTSVEIAQWIGDRLNISSWKAGEFFGERKVLSSPQALEETERLKKFIQSLGVSWSKANGGSNNHAQYFLLDGNIQNTLFGETNMISVNERLDRFNTDWENMGNDFTTKAQYLLEKIGLDIKGDWSKLTGTRLPTGDFLGSGSLFASGSLDSDGIIRMGLDQHACYVYLFYAPDARLCFLS